MALPVTLVTLGGMPVQLVDQTGSVFPTTGTGSLVFNTTPTLITPILGAATGTSLALGGATIGSNALVVTGNAHFGSVTVDGAGLYINTAAAAWVALNGRANGDIVAFSTGRIGFTLSGTNANGVAPDAYITRDGAGILSMRDSTNAQAFRVYNTYTDASNYSRLSQSWSSNFAVFAIESLGTGTASDIRLQASGGTNIDVTTGSGVNIYRNGSSNTTTLNISGTSLSSTGQLFTRLTPTINQASGTYTVLDINPTETAIGAGPHYLIKGRIGAGANVFQVTNAGSLYAAGNVTAGTGGAINFSNRTGMNSPSDGILQLYNAAGTDFARLQFGGTTSSFPALARNGTTLGVRLADNSDDAPFSAASYAIGNAGLGVSWVGRSQIKSPADGNLLLQNNAANDFTRLQFGGTTSSFPAIKRVTTALHARLADDSNYADVVAARFSADSGLVFLGSNGSLSAPSDGVLLLRDNAGTSFTRLQFGGTGATYPSIKRNAAGIDFRLADDSAYADTNARTYTASVYLRVIATTVASLPSASGAGQGAIVSVTDATATTSRSVLAGGGANKVMVWSDGTNWLIF